ncbi:sensor histidine kinase [Psychrobacter lutiphocae]|uniref:sensor histidine kinase n=1 Tax=Psychrobacter lutiphocae TaxID=540500 RepID=UPI0003700F36|nr:ATP-binding protein [Psychrobacter lutiphocae]
MNSKIPNLTFISKMTQPLTLFWRLFLSMLLVLLLTSTLSVAIERWINTRQINNRMQHHVNQLITSRDQIVKLLQVDDLQAVELLYQTNRSLVSQILITDEQGRPLFQNRHQRHMMHMQHMHMTPFMPHMMRHTVDNIDKNTLTTLDLRDSNMPRTAPWQYISADASAYPEIKEVIVTGAQGHSYTIRLMPRLPLRDVLALRQDYTLVRIVLIVLFSILVCYWLSRALTQRIRNLQQAIHMMSEGSYQAAEQLTDVSNNKLGKDELGQLAKDVAKLSTRLAESELARKQMLSDISHELRSPLARLEIATELTRDFAPEANHYLDRIEKESSRMNQLIEHIIRIQSLQMRQHILNLESYHQLDLCTLLDEIKADVCFEFQEKSVHWQWQVAADTSYQLLADPLQLHSAFENIIRNAFTHTAPNSTVTVSLDTLSLEGSKQPAIPAIKVQVIDAGDGVAESDLHRIFQPFVRLSSSRERIPQHDGSVATGNYKYQGYGLGLAIAHAIILSHQGQLVAYNRQDNQSGLVIEAILPTHL